MARRQFDIYKETRFLTSPRTYALELARALADCDTLLDIGCGSCSPLRFLRCSRLVGVDIYQDDLDRAKTAQTHDEFIKADARCLRRYFQENSFDACVALDLIEHLPKNDGLAFLKDLEYIAKRKVVISTPNGFLRQSSRTAGDSQEHLSGWTPQEMRDLGYRVIGIIGLRHLRTEHHRLRFSPEPLWAVVSWLTQHLACRYCPTMAAAILCIKDLHKPDIQ